MTASLEPLFRPASIAVVGASRRPGTIGWQIVHNLLLGGYQGVVHPVNPSASAVHGVPAYPSVAEIPGSVDLAVIVVPKEGVVEVAEACGQKGVGALVVISAGFREIGGQGVERERRLVEVAERHGMRLVGPNCMGVVNTAPDVSMNATFAPTMPPAGALSFMSQSGALGVTILDYAAEYGIGIHHFVSVGNKPDVSGNDLLEHWEEDPDTRVVLLYLENFGNPRRFTRIARRVSRRKPVVVVKSGRTRAGARAASSHTGAPAGADVATDALLAQCGVLRADSVEELFDYAMAFEHAPVPAGNRVAIVTNAGGPGIIIADACESAGLEVAELSERTRERLREVFPEEASVRNPVDMIASATGDSYRTALSIVLEDEGVDAAIAAFVPPLGVRQQDVAAAIVAARGADRDDGRGAEADRRADKPILAVLMGREGLPAGRAELQEAGVPAYTFPESAARSLAALHRHRLWLERPVEEPRRFDVDAERVSEVLDRVLAEGREDLTEVEALEVLDAYGIPVVPHRVVSDPDRAVRAAEELGLPAVVKAVAAGIVHKTEAGTVRVDLRDADEVREAARNVAGRAREAHEAGETRDGETREAGGDASDGALLVEPYLRGGRETIVGVSQDPTFGPVLMFGLGGIYVEALGDVSFRVHPVSAVDAGEMVRSIRGLPLLEGVRGEDPADLETLAEVIERVSQLVGDHHRIRELDINPFLAFGDGGVAVDGRMRVALPEPLASAGTSEP